MRRSGVGPAGRHQPDRRPRAGRAYRGTGEFRAGLRPADWPETVFEAPPQRYEPARVAVLAQPGPPDTEPARVAVLAQPGPPDTEPAPAWPFGPPTGVSLRRVYCNELEPPQAVRLGAAHDP